MEIVNIFGRVAALGHTYSELCAAVYLSWQGSCTLRCTWTVEDPLGAVDGPWLLRAHGAAHLTDSIFFGCICSPVLWPNCGKHLTSRLVLHFFAQARMKWESISQALCSCTDLLVEITA